MRAKGKAGRSMAVKMVDSLRNLVSGLGTDRDKTTFGQYFFAQLDRAQLEAAYRSDWIAAKVIDIPAQDATRQWRSWQAEEDQIELLEEAEKKLGIQRKTMSALQKARLYGGAAMIMGLKGANKNSQLPLLPEKIQKEELEFLHVCTRYEITAGDLITDVMNPEYGRPSWYEVSGANGPVRVHPSRVLRFVGREYPSLNAAGANDGWGDSILQVVDDAIKNASTSAQGIAALIQEAKIDVIKMPNFMMNIGTEDYENRVISRFQLANISKSIVNALVLDKDEEWERIEQNFAHLDAIEQMFLLMASGAADIPATRLLGQSPAGMSATGESDLRNYYDNIGHQQTNFIEPELCKLDEVLIRSVLGDRPDELYYEWRPLWQMDATQKADIALKKAQTFQIDVNSGMIPHEALAKARVNQLVEDGFYPGLEAAMEEAPDIEDQWEEEAQLKQQQFEVMAKNRQPMPGQKPGKPPMPPKK